MWFTVKYGLGSMPTGLTEGLRFMPAPAPKNTNTTAPTRVKTETDVRIILCLAQPKHFSFPFLGHKYRDENNS